MRAIACALGLAAAGAGTGFVVALQEVLRQTYPAQGLWRTSLWICSGGAAVGAAIGAGCALAALLLISIWSRLVARPAEGLARGASQPPPPLTCPLWALRVIVLLGLLTAAAALLIPRRVPIRFGLPYPGLAISLLVLLWVGATMLGAGIAFRVPEPGRPEERLKLRWMTGLGFVYVIAFLHLWAWAKSWEALLGLAAASAVACILVYVLLLAVARIADAGLGAPLGRVIVGRPGQTLTGVVLAAALVLWVASWRSGTTARTEARRHGANVIVICIDTLRADRPSFFAADSLRDLTPNLRELLARRGTVYTKAITQAPWTMPAIASVMTGLYPAEHGAEQRWGVLGPTRLTLAEILREAGYRTLGISGAVYVTNASGLRQGFEAFDESQALDHLIISSRAITDKAIEFLGAHAREPLFLYAHYFDPHWAYRDHEDYEFADSYDGWLRDLLPDMKQNEFAEHVARVRPRPRRRLFDPDELAYLHDLYEEEIAFTDAEVGRLLRYVRDEGLEDNSLVIVFADHGEEFLERGNLGHGKTVHEALIHVPLLIAEPGPSDQAIVSHAVETRALFTTILDFLGVPPPDGRAAPTSLLSDDPTDPILVRSATYTLVSGEAGRRFREPVNLWWTCVQDGRWKLLKEHLRGRALLYDLAGDPGETNECSGEYPEHRKRLERQLDRLDAYVQHGGPSGAGLKADEEQQRRLRSLGYLGD